VELWLDSQEKVRLPKIPDQGNGIAKYHIAGGTNISIKLRHM